MMLHKDFGLEIKAVAEDGVIEGYGSTFGGEPDSYGDIVMPGAFAESLVKHKRAGTISPATFRSATGKIWLKTARASGSKAISISKTRWASACIAR
jgi:hypothetical protein